jgi:hypothetical protein
VFALEDLGDGALSVYAVDALAAAVRAGVLRGPVAASAAGAVLYEAGGAPGTVVAVEVLTSGTTADAPDYFRHMLGWNRKAIKVTLPTTATPSQVRAVEALCAMAARHAAG